VAALPILFAGATTIAQTTQWHGWTYVDSGGNTTFNKLEVQFAGTGGVNMRAVLNTSIPGATIANAPANGYTLNWPVVTPFKKGETITAEFVTAVANIEFLGATAYNGAAVVGTIDSSGALKSPAGVKLGKLTPALGVKAGAAEQVIINRIKAWGDALAAAPATAAGANAMADLYTADASLLPTFGIYALYRNLPYVVAKPSAPVIRNYFRHAFLPKMPTMQPLNMGAVHVVVAGNLASANGLYTFKTVANHCGAPTAPKFSHARFTFVFRNENGVWKVLQHHSSQYPGDAALKPVPAMCLGDISGPTIAADPDGKVDGIDLGALLAAWGAASPCADLNNDGTVNAADLGLLLASWGGC